MQEYYYLVSSLPMLQEGKKSLITVDDFMSSCETSISCVEYSFLQNLLLEPSENKNIPYKQIAIWNDFETFIRNKIVSIRENNFSKNSDSYEREVNDFFVFAENKLNDVTSANTPLESEKMLDSLRWGMLNELEVGNDFNFIKLCIYKLKLMISEKWITRDIETGNKQFDTIIDKIYSEQK